MTADLPRLIRVLLTALLEPGVGMAHELLAEHSPEEIAGRFRERGLPAALNRLAGNRLAGRDPLDLAAGILADTVSAGARVIIPGDEEWPSRLDDLAALGAGPGSHGPPLCLWARGPLNLRETLEESASIVGARDSTAYGDSMARELAFGLADRDWAVVSGGAFGIDTAAHRGALAADGPTVAILACGVDHVYPARNELLFAAIAERGLILSEWPPGALPLRHRFLIRNRLIAAATLGTVVVEAQIRSGARNTARHAVELDRQLMIVPGEATSPQSVGVHQLAREPGGARIVTRAAEIIEDLGRLGADLAEPLSAPDTALDRLDEVSSRILDAVPRRTAAMPAHIAAQAGVPLKAILKTLPTLHRAGLIEEADGRFRQTRAAIRPTPVDGRDMSRRGRMGR
ncbi:DNA-processing protein DprA [Phytomonospora endophytica]|uniref:DNA processing protein n=1 Tax=Phytomonospora endophytica TaxID=714109 RepID=A0A841FKM1_9ACTN|nr:DNA-processing protein DprA [Phytomonospora endophytica]MBB6032500.1 DNA processing protein [Phytomonospora endophytica]GIG66352.1 putative DNA processing protein DprA [Phytomonospora endophytica]